MAKRQELEKSAQSSGNTTSVFFKLRNHRKTYSRCLGGFVGFLGLLSSGRFRRLLRASGLWARRPEQQEYFLRNTSSNPEQREYPQRCFHAPKPPQNVFPLLWGPLLWARESAQSSGNTPSVVFKPRNHRKTYSRRSGRENQPRAAGIPPACFSSFETIAKRIPAVWAVSSVSSGF